MVDAATVDGRDDGGVVVADAEARVLSLAEGPPDTTLTPQALSTVYGIDVTVERTVDAGSDGLNSYVVYTITFESEALKTGESLNRLFCERDDARR